MEAEKAMQATTMNVQEAVKIESCRFCDMEDKDQDRDEMTDTFENENSASARRPGKNT